MRKKQTIKLKIVMVALTRNYPKYYDEEMKKNLRSKKSLHREASF